MTLGLLPFNKDLPTSYFLKLVAMQASKAMYLHSKRETLDADAALFERSLEKAHYALFGQYPPWRTVTKIVVRD
jgi:hypothetical protein